ncbi:MAG: hypothetical protein ABIY50_13430, partial [Ignavibacteria bacterium]
MQTEVNRLLNRGIIFGMIWIIGIGSVIALTSGFQANKLIRQSGNILEGKKKVTQCFIIGIAGLIVLAAALSIIIIFRNNKPYLQ